MRTNTEYHFAIKIKPKASQNITMELDYNVQGTQVFLVRLNGDRISGFRYPFVF